MVPLLSPTYSPASGTLDAAGVSTALSTMYDGDMLLMSDVSNVNVDSNITISASIVLHGRLINASEPAG